MNEEGVVAQGATAAAVPGSAASGSA